MTDICVKCGHVRAWHSEPSEGCAYSFSAPEEDIICACQGFVEKESEQMLKATKTIGRFDCVCGHKLIEHSLTGITVHCEFRHPYNPDYNHLNIGIRCPCLEFRMKKENVQETCPHIATFHFLDNYRCNYCGIIGTAEFFREPKKNMNIKELESELCILKANVKNLEEKIAKKKNDFAVTVIPIDMMDSEIRDARNLEPTKYTWVVGNKTNGTAHRIPIRLMTDDHLKNTFGIFVKGNHVCYPEMKNEMIRRGLLGNY